MPHREPLLDTVPIAELRPTQVTVGFREVAIKRREWEDLGGKEVPKFLSKHLIPTVLGPGGRHYLTDHHHLALALLQAGQEEALVTVVLDLSALSKTSFWVYLDNRSLCHSYDAAGVRRDFSAIPKRIKDLKDDPYRSLAGELRRAGGFAKETTPFLEFLWADFLRTRVRAKVIEERFSSAMEKALQLARSEAATYLPGWCGPHPD